MGAKLEIPSYELLLYRKTLRILITNPGIVTKVHYSKESNILISNILFISKSIISYHQFSKIGFYSVQRFKTMTQSHPQLINCLSFPIELAPAVKTPL